MCCKAWKAFHAEARGWLALQSVRSTTITVTATLLVSAIFDLAGESEGCVKRTDICEAAKAESQTWCSTLRDVCDGSWCALANGTTIAPGTFSTAGNSSALWTECRVQFLGHKFTQLALVSIPTLIVNLVLSVLTPLIGVLCDISPPALRRHTVAVCNLSMAGCQLVAGMLLRAHWQLALLCTFAGSCMFLIGFAPMFAYLPELLQSMTGTVSLANFSMGLQMTINVGVIVICVFINRWTGSSVTATQSGSFLSGAIILGTCVYSLKRLGAAAQAKAAAAGESASPPMRELFVIGFRKLLCSLRSLPQEYPLQALYVLSYALEQAAQRSLVFLLSAFLIEAFGFTQVDISFLVFWILLLSIAGTVVMRWLSQRMRQQDFKRALVFAIACKTISIMLIPLLARGSSAGDKIIVFVCAIPIGLVFAVTFALQRGVYASITPGGQEAEFFGYLVVGANIFAWAPPMIATIMTEAGGVDVRYTMLGSISTFQVLSVLVLTRFDLDGAKQSVQCTLQHRTFVENETDVTAATSGAAQSQSARGHARVHPQSKESSAPEMHVPKTETEPAPVLVPAAETQSSS